jgi:hypothetical protein
MLWVPALLRAVVVFLDVAAPVADLRLHRRGEVVGGQDGRIWCLLAGGALGGMCWPRPLDEGGRSGGAASEEEVSLFSVTSPWRGCGACRLVGSLAMGWHRLGGEVGGHVRRYGGGAVHAGVGRGSCGEADVGSVVCF